MRSTTTSLARRGISELVNRSAVSTKSEGLRNVAAIANGLLRLADAAGNRINAGTKHSTGMQGRSVCRTRNRRNTGEKEAFLWLHEQRNRQMKPFPIRQ